MAGEFIQKHEQGVNPTTSSGLSIANSGVLYVFRKAEKITTALYLVTNLFPDREPLRVELRMLALQLLSSLFPTPRGSGATRFSEDIHPAVSRLVSLIELAHTAGLISEMNHVILRDEYTNLIESVQEQVKLHSFDFSINESVFSSAKSTLLEQKQEQAPNREHVNTPPDKVSQSDTVKDTSKGQPLKDTHLTLTRKDHASRKTTVQKDPARREIIVNMLKKHGTISIKDVVGIVSGCSEKTIQREFTALVEEGVIKREGKRRWSRYSLMNN